MPKRVAFVSHRHEDAKIAKLVERELDKLSEGRLKIEISENIPQGVDWRLNIESALKSAHFLILVYGDASEDWSWCFYEVGYFQAWHAKSIKKNLRRVFCFRPEAGNPPGPINHLQQRADLSGFSNMISQMVAATGIPCAREKYEETAERIAASIREVKYGDPKRISFKFENVEDIEEKMLPTEAKIEGSSAHMDAVFGYGQGELTWAQVVNKLASADRSMRLYDLRWQNEITRVIWDATQGVIKSPQCVLFGRTGESRYRFVFNHARKLPEGGFVCEFVVAEDVGGPPRNVPASLLALVTSIRMAVRVRHEVIERYKIEDIRNLADRERMEKLDDMRE